MVKLLNCMTIIQITHSPTEEPLQKIGRARINSASIEEIDFAGGGTVEIWPSAFFCSSKNTQYSFSQPYSPPALGDAPRNANSDRAADAAGVV